MYNFSVKINANLSGELIGESRWLEAPGLDCIRTVNWPEVIGRAAANKTAAVDVAGSIFFHS